MKSSNVYVLQSILLIIPHPLRGSSKVFIPQVHAYVECTGKPDRYIWQKCCKKWMQ